MGRGGRDSNLEVLGWSMMGVFGMLIFSLWIWIL